MKSVHVIVHGRVQGVGFREWTRRMAEQRHLDGWVRNREEGTVEAVFAGYEAAVQSMLVLVQKGPPSAHVTKVNVEDCDAPAEKGFLRLPTA